MRPEIDRAADRLVDAAVDGDAATIRGVLGEAVTSGGMWFDDGACREQFGEAGAIPEEELEGFATCLATLPLARGARESETPRVAVLEYQPGIELEAAFDTRARLIWIGYSGRRGAGDVLPTITGETLEALREGSRGVVAETEGTSWLKVCLDSQGKVRAVHPRSTTSTEALEAALAIAKEWKFRPFTLGGRPAAVCAMAALADPGGEDVTRAVLPLSLPDAFSAAIVMPAQRIAGALNVVPDDADRIKIAQSGGMLERHVRATFQLCIDPDGAVAGLTMMETSGYPRYDEKIARSIAGWKYKPVEIDGSLVTVCAAISIIYIQKA